MLAIKKSENNTPSCAVNILPCRIQHNGPVNASTRHWTPEASDDGKSNTAYFRGRKLNGTVVELPDGYKGMRFTSLSSVCRTFFFNVHVLICIRSRTQRGKKGREKEKLISTTGAILQKTDTILLTTTTTSNVLDEDTEEQDSTPETKILDQLATFDKITVYGHEVQPDAQEDVYVKGVNEWIGLAGAVSCFRA